jgi:hypothetical protein
MVVAPVSRVGHGRWNTYVHHVSSRRTQLARAGERVTKLMALLDSASDTKSELHWLKQWRRECQT